MPPLFSRDGLLAYPEALRFVVSADPVSAGFSAETTATGKAGTIGAVSLVTALLARFSGELREDSAENGSGLVEKDNE